MRVITGDRGAGKTTRLIKRALEIGGILIVTNNIVKDWVMQLAKEHDLPIHQPITHPQFFMGDRLIGMPKTPLLIDDALNLFYSFVSQYAGKHTIDSISINVDEEKYEHLIPDPEALKKLIEFRQAYFPVDPHAYVPVAKLWELEHEISQLKSALADSQRREREAVGFAAAALGLNQGEQSGK